MIWRLLSFVLMGLLVGTFAGLATGLSIGAQSATANIVIFILFAVGAAFAIGAIASIKENTNLTDAEEIAADKAGVKKQRTDTGVAVVTFSTFCLAGLALGLWVLGVEVF